MNFIFPDPSFNTVSFILFYFIFFDASIRVGRYLKKKSEHPNSSSKRSLTFSVILVGYLLGIFLEFISRIFFWRFVIRISSHPRSVYLSKFVLSNFFLPALRFDRNILPSTASLVTSLWTHPNLNHLRGIAFPPTSKSRIEIIIQCDPNKQE